MPKIQQMSPSTTRWLPATFGGRLVSWKSVICSIFCKLEISSRYLKESAVSPGPKTSIDLRPPSRKQQGIVVIKPGHAKVFDFIFEFKVAINFEFILEIFVNFEFNFKIFCKFWVYFRAFGQWQNDAVTIAMVLPWLVIIKGSFICFYYSVSNTSSMSFDRQM